MDSFVDLGSECSMIKRSQLPKLGTIRINIDDLPVLRGFGNSVVHSLGKINAEVEIDGVKANLELLVVPDDVMEVSLMIGQTFTEQHHVMIQKTGEHFDILYNSFDDITKSNKIRIINRKCSEITSLSILEVYTEPQYKGELYIVGGLRNDTNSAYFIPEGLFQFDDDGNGQIIINNLSSKPLSLTSNILITRGSIANQEIDYKVLHVSESKDQRMNPITATDLNISGDLDQTTVNELLILLNKYRHCFAFSLSELGHSSICEMSIDLHSSEPVVYRPYRLAMKEKEVVREMMNELLENDIVRPSVSPFASPIVLVRKKSGEYRLCIDYRALNKNTVRENYPMPLIDDQIDALAGNEFFTALDMASGYYQISIKEQDRHKTAFVTPEGHYEFNRMPFGLANAPATFQRMMHQVLGGLRHMEAMAYLGPISPTPNLH
ncbi:unnamed protein product [Euphydryas editha]|uniref:Reverse transcriptase domain-containing protein n=1 Tax=Euphydryas editha TaxID=104508 RepID=A0AAU9TRL8_EUPED|nr:unnamed protein product [Euphydryas editha]